MRLDLLGGLELREPALLCLCVLAVPVYLWTRAAGGRVRYSSLTLLPAPADPRARSLRLRLAGLPAVLLALGAVALAVALAGPRRADQNSRIKRQGIAMMMVVDVSGSMQALDLSTPDRERTRLDAVKEVFADFVRGTGGHKGRPDDLIGIVSFAGYADTRCPLTLDHDNLLRAAEKLQIPTQADEDGTALGDGLGLALERLRESKARSRVAILLTDGVNNRGETAPMQAAELAATIGVKVYTVGAGTNGVAPVRVTDGLGRSALRQMPVEIDEALLRDVAQRTGGRYFRATDAAELVQIYKDIDALERTEFTETRYRQYTEYYGYVLSLGLLLIGLGWGLGGTVLRRLP